MGEKRKSSIGTRGPTARRGLQYAETSLPELLSALAKAKVSLRLMQAINSSLPSGSDEVSSLRMLSKSELAKLRRENLALQTDLRAELRRRGAI